MEENSIKILNDQTSKVPLTLKMKSPSFSD